MPGITVVIPAIFVGAAVFALAAAGGALRDHRARIIAILGEPVQ